MPKRSETVETVPVPELTMAGPEGPIEVLAGPAPEPEGEAEAPRRRRRRRKQAEPEPEPQVKGPSPEELARCQVALTAMFDILGKIMAKRRGDHWKLDDEESSALAGAWTNALAPYLEKIGAAMPFAAAAAVTFGVIKPRLDRDAEMAALASGEPAA